MLSGGIRDVLGAGVGVGVGVGVDVGVEVETGLRGVVALGWLTELGELGFLGRDALLSGTLVGARRVAGVELPAVAAEASASAGLRDRVEGAGGFFRGIVLQALFGDQ